MEFKLSNILESTVLSEGRKEDAMKKYGASKELVDKLSTSDPSGNNKYLMWMVGQVMGAGEGGQIPLADTVADVVQRFHKQVNRLNKDMAEEAGVSSKVKNNPKDINSYNDINELDKIVKVAENKVTDKEIKKEVDKIYEDENILVMVPITVRASCKYGAGTKWCITGGAEGSYNTHFDNYSKDAVFYFITDKTTDQRSSPKHYKYALQYYHKGKKTWWDAQDISHQSAPPFINTESGRKAMDVVEKYHLKAAGEKLKREIERFILQPSAKNYKTYSSHLSQPQKEEVIKKIISTEGYTIQVLEALVSDLTEEQKNKVLTNLTGLNSSTFNKVKNELNNEQLINVVSKNPIILNNTESTKYLDDKLSDEEKFTLAGKLDRSKVSNTDSKVILTKWAMTPEERAKHGENSTYVFLLDTVDGQSIEKIIKVNSLDPESYKIINGLKLRATMDRGLNMYAIKTERDLLDEWEGKGGNDIPPSVMKSIMEKSVKI
jgi:hypothetical protein